MLTSDTLRRSLYHAAGLSLLLAGLTLSVLTYSLLGLMPLVALWIGTSIVGASMLLTPSEHITQSALIAFIRMFEDTIAMLIEQFRVHSLNMYIPYGDYVYILVFERPPARIPEKPPKTLINVKDNNLLISLKSPISRSLIQGFNDACAALEWLIVEELGLADNVYCISEDDRLIITISRPIISSPRRLEESIGSIYGVIAASVAALIMGAASVEEDTEENNTRRIVIRVLERTKR